MLSLVTRNVLAIPISTIAYESVFSIGDCVVNPFQSSLTPTVMKALVVVKTGYFLHKYQLTFGN